MRMMLFGTVEKWCSRERSDDDWKKNTDDQEEMQRFGLIEVREA
jgi:hypothetical protein